MAKPNRDELLSAARAELHDKNIVTLLGKTGAGKTVASALLKHALFDKFIPMHAGRFEAIVKKGGERIDEILAGMSVDCEFPPATFKVDAPKLELVVLKMIGEGAGKSTLMFQDSSGEKYTELLQDELVDPEERLEEILAYNIKNNEVGPLAPYVFSKVYLLAIQCPKEISGWHLQHSSSTINALCEIHKAAQLTHNQKIKSHIAILFTQADVLQEECLNKPASDLLELMPELKSALRLCHGGDLECFKLSIATELESEQDRDERIRANKQTNKDKRRQYNADLQKHTSESVARAREETEADGEALEDYLEEVATEASEAFQISHPAPVLESEDEIELKRKVKEGFEYSQNEYVRLLIWIIDRLYN